MQHFHKWFGILPQSFCKCFSLGFLCSPGSSLSWKTTKPINDRHHDRHAEKVLWPAIRHKHSKRASF